MDEIDFLPAWYPRLRNRKRWIVVQSWTTLLFIAVLGCWLLFLHRDISVARGSLQMIRAQITLTQGELNKLDDLLRLQTQWRQQDRIIDRLGLHVETTRMLNAIESAMPPGMAIRELGLDIGEETPRGLAAISGAGRDAVPIGRKLKAHLLGVVPNDVDLANFLAAMGNISIFDQIAVGYSKDRFENGRLLREFELTFEISLNGAPGS